MIDQVMFHAAHGRSAARFSAACFFATLMLVAAGAFDPGRHGGVLQPGAGTQTDSRGKAQSG